MNVEQTYRLVRSLKMVMKLEMYITWVCQMTHDGVRKAQDVFVKALRAYRPKAYRGIIHLVCPMGREDWRRSVEAFWPDAYGDVRVHGIGGAVPCGPCGLIPECSTASSAFWVSRRTR